MTTDVIENATPDVNELVNDELVIAKKEVEELQDTLEVLEDTKTAIENYSNFLENNMEEPMDYFGKKLLSTGMENLGYPISMVDIESRFPYAGGRFHISVALESLGEQLKQVNVDITNLTDKLTQKQEQLKGE